MYDNLFLFESMEEMRCAVLEAPPSGLADETPKWVVRAIDAIRQDDCFQFGTFDLHSENFLESAKQGKRAFAAGTLRLPQHEFTGLATLVSKGIPLPAIVMAAEVPGTAHILTSPVLYVHVVTPALGKDGGLEFPNALSPLFVWAYEGHLDCRWMGQTVDEFVTRRTSRRGIPEIPLFTLFAMLSLLADDRSTISRTVAPVQVNNARARRGLRPIPPKWTVSRGDLVESKQLCN